MTKEAVSEWLAKVSKVSTKVVVEKEKLIKADKVELKRLYEKLNDYEEAGLTFVCKVLNLCPEDADKVFRSYALLYRKRREKVDGSISIYIDLPIYPMSGHLKYYADKALPIARGWYGIANALCRLSSEQEHRIVELIERKDTLK